MNNLVMEQTTKNLMQQANNANDQVSNLLNFTSWSGQKDTAILQQALVPTLFSPAYPLNTAA